jgi:hypothetical protein
MENQIIGYIGLGAIIVVFAIMVLQVYGYLD